MNNTLARRLETLREALDKESLRGVVLNQSAYIFHITDWLPPAWANVFLVVGLEDSILVSPFAPEDTIAVWSASIVYNAFSLDELVPAPENALAALRQALSQAKLLGQSVGTRLSSIPGAFALPLQREIDWCDASNLIYAVTAVKDEAAQQAIRQRVGFLDRAFEVAAKTIKPGISELQVFGAIYSSLAQSLGGPLILDCNFGSGERSVSNEPQPTNKLLQLGETILIDLFPNLGGYVADYTRNFVVGDPTDGQRAQHVVLEKALSAAQALLRPGVLASEVDRLVRRIIEEEGFGEFAHQHHSGHAFGLTIPEPPWIIPADHTPLRSGMVIAVEPGIYHPINGGMRLEGNFIINEDGCQSLAGFPATLIACK
jgi:Xaa-Pro aminopeptidase